MARTMIAATDDILTDLVGSGSRLYTDLLDAVYLHSSMAGNLLSRLSVSRTL
jgi:hypothetical protein